MPTRRSNGLEQIVGGRSYHKKLYPFLCPNVFARLPKIKANRNASDWTLSHWGKIRRPQFFARSCFYPTRSIYFPSRRLRGVRAERSVRGLVVFLKCIVRTSFL